MAQNIAGSGNEQDPLGPPTQRGIRFTPGMARAVSRLFTKNVLVPHYELDPAKTDEAAELMARRLMSTAHTLDADGAAFAETLVTRIFEFETNRKEGESESNPFNAELQKEMAQRALPAMPAIREFVGGVGRDIMPMLSLKQQLKMTAELAAAGTALNGFEQNMQRWARGEGRPGEDPFSDSASREKQKAEAESTALATARKAADSELNKQEWLRQMWENYLKQFKSFYALDESQAAAAESILRDYLERAKVLMQDAGWREQIYRSRLWLALSSRLQMKPAFRNVLNSRYDEAMAPLNDLGDQFRARLEEIPTAAQKQAANARIEAALKERGYEAAEAK